MSEEFMNNSTNNLNLANLNKLNFEAERAINDIYKKDYNSNMDETLEERLQKSKELYMENQLHQFNKLKYEIEMQGRKILELESFNLKVQDENMKLVKRIEDYQKLNKEWEFKVNNIRTNVSDLEENNKKAKQKLNYQNLIIVLTKENEELKEEIDDLNFKLKLSQEKEKLHETNLKNFKEIQLEYENKLLENKKENKSKEDNLRKKYEIFEDNLTKKIKEQEAENIEKFQKLNFSFKETHKIIEKKDEEIWLLRDKLKNSELFFTQKEQEFNDLIGNKDKKLKDLELCIKKISEEARNQLNSLTNVIENYERKFDEMKNKENKLFEEINYFKDSGSKFKKNDANQVNLSTLTSSAAKNAGNTEREILNKISSNKSKLSIDFNESEESKNRLIEKLRGKIRMLEEENLKLSKDLSDVFRENERINEEYLALYNETKLKEHSFLTANKQKDTEIDQLIDKINELEINIERYEGNLINIRKNYDNTVFEYQQEISRKNEDIKFMAETHAKEIKEMQNKFEQVLIKENQFLNSLNLNTFGTANSLNLSRNNVKNVFKENLGYNLKPVPDDDENVRNNISQQINIIKDKLDKTFYG